MELKEFINDVLNQMGAVKAYENKKKNLVDVLEFELTLSATDNGKIGVSFLGIGANVGTNIQTGQKVKIILKPKNQNHL